MRKPAKGFVSLNDHSPYVVGDFAESSRIPALLSLVCDTEEAMVFSNFARASANKSLK